MTVIGKHEHDTFASELNRNIEAGNTRVTRRVQILETVEKISPDVPLPPTNLPAAFADIDGEAIVMQQDEGDDFDYTPN